MVAGATSLLRLGIVLPLLVPGVGSEPLADTKTLNATEKEWNRECRKILCIVDCRGGLNNTGSRCGWDLEEDVCLYGLTTDPDGDAQFAAHQKGCTFDWLYENATEALASMAEQIKIRGLKKCPGRFCGRFPYHVTPALPYEHRDEFQALLICHHTSDPVYRQLINPLLTSIRVRAPTATLKTDSPCGPCPRGYNSDGFFCLPCDKRVTL